MMNVGGDLNDTCNSILRVNIKQTLCGQGTCNENNFRVQLH